MKTTVTAYDFHRAFENCGRSDQFSYEARTALFRYLEELEDDTGEEMELDVIALCCEYAEHETAIEAATEYGWDPDEEDEDEDEAREWLEYHTTMIDFGSGIIIQQF